MIRNLWISATLVLLGTPIDVCATDYRVEFDCFSESPHPPCKSVYSLIAVLDDTVFSSIEWGSGVPGHQNEHFDGSRIMNDSETGKKILAIKINIGDASTHDRFLVDAASAGHLFSEVWRKTDGSAAIFNGANSNAGIAVGEYFWMKVLPHTANNPQPTNLFGRASETNFPVPADGSWEKVFPATPPPVAKLNPRTKKFAGLPRVNVYAESADGSRILALSHDNVILHDSAADVTRFVHHRQTLPAGINRITSDTSGPSEAFVLWKDGEEVARLPIAQLKLGSAVLKHNDAIH